MARSFPLLLSPLLLALVLLLVATAPVPAHALRRSRNAPIQAVDVVYIYNRFGRRMRRQLSPAQFAAFDAMRQRLPCRELECLPACETRAVNFGCPRCIAECSHDRVHATNLRRLRAYTAEERARAEAGVETRARANARANTNPGGAHSRGGAGASRTGPGSTASSSGGAAMRARGDDTTHAGAAGAANTAGAAGAASGAHAAGTGQARPGGEPAHALGQAQPRAPLPVPAPSRASVPLPAPARASPTSLTRAPAPTASSRPTGPGTVDRDRGAPVMPAAAAGRGSARATGPTADGAALSPTRRRTHGAEMTGADWDPAGLDDEDARLPAGIALPAPIPIGAAVG